MHSFFRYFCSFERKFVQDLRQQQDEAYEESLRADQEKERLKQMERDRILQQQLQEEAERLEKQREKEVCGTFPPEPEMHNELKFQFGFDRTLRDRRLNEPWRCPPNQTHPMQTLFYYYLFYQTGHGLNDDFGARIC